MHINLCVLHALQIIYPWRVPRTFHGKFPGKRHARTGSLVRNREFDLLPGSHVRSRSCNTGTC